MSIVSTRIHLNEQMVETELDSRMTLLDFLREVRRLTGTKKGCDHGQCGACTVHVDGHRELSCLRLVASLEGRSVTTIEGIGTATALNPLQAAFIRHDAFQCGFCTPGQIMSGLDILSDPAVQTAADVREQMSGNICRCGAYPNIVAAILDVKDHAVL